MTLLRSAFVWYTDTVFRFMPQNSRPGAAGALEKRKGGRHGCIPPQKTL